MMSKIILRKDHAMKRHPVHDSFSVQTQLALIAGSLSAWWLQLPPLEEGKSVARLSQLVPAPTHQPTGVPPTTESNPTQRSVDNTTGKPLFCGGLVLMQPPC